MRTTGLNNSSHPTPQCRAQHHHTCENATGGFGFGE